MAGLVDGQLAPPPKSPNCVSTQADPEDSHYIAPIPWDGTVIAAKAAIKAWLLTVPRTELVSEDGPYLHVTFTTAVFRWVDDVEFLISIKEACIHFRSASRTGHSDLGVNRRRMEGLRAAWRT